MARDLSAAQKADIFDEAKERLQIGLEFESEARALALQDTKFANGDPDNKWQWPDRIRGTRELSNRPCLTINKTRQYNLAIINDCKMNKPAIKYRAMGGGATAESAKAWNAIGRRIEYASNAQLAYDMATACMVEGGIGYWRLETDYVREDSFDQDLFIRPIRDPLSVVLDPNIIMPDGSDAEWGIIFEDLEDKVFKVRYPKRDLPTQGSLDTNGWISKNTVRIAEYFRKVREKDRLMMTEAGPVYEKDIGAKMFDGALEEALKAGTPLPEREVLRTRVERIMIIGTEVDSVAIWPGKKYIPIVRCVGDEKIIEGRLDRKGHTRNIKDAQRMYNYWSSAAVEYGALQTKTPYLVDVASIQGLEKYWEGANVNNYPYLPYNSVGDSGEKYAEPKRIEPPAAMPVAITAMQIAGNEMTMASGQTDAAMGQQSNERTGEALLQRQRSSDRATYHFTDSLAAAVRYTGRIILDVVPQIYDTERVLVCLAEDETELTLQNDPTAEQAYQESQNGIEETVLRMFNPRKGEYEVAADQGPSYATRRQEAFNAFTLMLTQSPELTQQLGDLLFRAGDFPMADEAAQRLKRGVPPYILGKGPSPAEQQLQQQLEDLRQQLSDTLYENAELRLKNIDKGTQNENDEYNALTKRLDTLLKYVQPLLMPQEADLAMAGAMQQDTSGMVEEQADLFAQQMQPRIPPQAPGPGSGLPAPRPMRVMEQPGAASPPAPQAPQGRPQGPRPAGPPQRGPMGPGGQ